MQMGGEGNAEGVHMGETRMFQGNLLNSLGMGKESENGHNR